MDKKDREWVINEIDGRIFDCPFCGHKTASTLISHKIDYYDLTMWDTKLCLNCGKKFLKSTKWEEVKTDEI